MIAREKLIKRENMYEVLIIRKALIRIKRD